MKFSEFLIFSVNVCVCFSGDDFEVDLTKTDLDLFLTDVVSFGFDSFPEAPGIEGWIYSNESFTVLTDKHTFETNSSSTDSIAPMGDMALNFNTMIYQILTLSYKNNVEYRVFMSFFLTIQSFSVFVLIKLYKLKYKPSNYGLRTRIVRENLI
jgi:hypothetical protein